MKLEISVYLDLTSLSQSSFTPYPLPSQGIKRKLDCFKDITDNTRDGFSDIVPVKHIHKTPQYRNPVALVRSVVCIQYIEYSEAPLCVRTHISFK